MKELLNQQIFYILFCLFFPISWGVFVDVLFSLFQKPHHKADSDQIQYHI